MCSVFNEEMAADMLQLHQHEDGADALEGYQETVAGIYAAHATLKARAMLLRDPSSDLYITRGMYESQTLGSFRGMTAEEYNLRDELYSDSHMIARLFETGMWNKQATKRVCVCQRLRESVLFIGTQFSILYTSMFSPA